MNTTRVGERHSRVSIYKFSEKPDGQGGMVTGDKEPVDTVWAYIHPARFWEGNSGGGAISGITQGITIRERDDVDESCRLAYKNITYEILHCDYSVPGEITLTCKAVVHRG